MRVSKYLFGIWTAVAVYTLFSITNGPRGLSAYNQLLSERDHQWANMKELGFVNDELEKVKNSLLHDPDTLLIHARQLGYGSEDERFVRIVGLGSSQNTLVAAGKVYFAKNPDYIPDKKIKITALCAGLAVFALLFILELIETKVR